MMTLPNLITLARIFLIPVFIGLFYLQPNYLDGEPLGWIYNALIAIFIIISATDFIDGFLARRLNQVSALGAFLDPVAMSTFLGMKNVIMMMILLLNKMIVHF